jgi:hypothetical protein
MRIQELKEGMFAPDGELTVGAYNKILKDLETKGINNKKATAAKNMVMNLWNSGDRLTGNYKNIIKDFDIDI